MAEAFGLTVAAWSPLGGGVLSGKFTTGKAPTTDTRIAADSISAADLAAARAVDRVAADLGTTPAAVALAWTMAHSSSIHPIIGARTLAQLQDNLGVVDLVLPDDAIAALEQAAPFVAGFPNDFIAETRQWVMGAAAVPVDPRRNRAV